jgi:predicted RNA-binding protein with PIN domain
VFDGWKTGAGQEHQSVVGGVKVIYSRIGDKADTVIKRILTLHRREWIVVTSDRDIADHAWSVDSIPISSDSFLSAFRRYSLSVPEEGEDQDNDLNIRRKGNPRQLSRKEKAVRRALQKL